MSKILDHIFGVTQKVTLLKNYGKVKIYCGGGNIRDWHQLSKEEQTKRLKKDWYISWSYRNPITGRLEQQPRIKRGNAHKNFKERAKILKYIKKILIEKLEDGFNPYALKENKKTTGVSEAFEKALVIKKELVSEKYYKDLKYSCNRLINWMNENSYSVDDINLIDKKVINEYLNHLLLSVSVKTRNDQKTNLNSVFNELENQELINSNYIATINNIKRDKKKSTPYTSKQAITIENYLKENDYDLYLFVRMISLMFYRPIELVRIKIEDINFELASINVSGQTNNTKQKNNRFIPKIFMAELEKYVSGHSSHYLFTNKGIGIWNINEQNKRSYFTRRYSKIKKQLGFGPEYNLYSHRHFTISRYYTYLRNKKSLSKTQAIDELSLITQHKSNAIESYIHYNQLERPVIDEDAFNFDYEG